MTSVIEKNICDDDVGTDGEFNRDYVRQVSAAAFDLFLKLRKQLVSGITRVCTMVRS